MPVKRLGSTRLEQQSAPAAPAPAPAKAPSTSSSSGSLGHGTVRRRG